MLRGAVRSPLIISAIAAFAAIVGVVTLWAAASAPWLGTTLIPLDEHVVTERGAFGLDDGAMAVSIRSPNGQPMALTALDLLAEPDGLPSYAEIAAFYARQDMLSQLLDEPVLELTLRSSDGSTIVQTVTPEARPLWTLPVSFWIQFATGLISVLISGWVWATRPFQLAPTLFAISGLGVVMVTMTSAFYAHRGLALPADLYAVLMPVNHAGIVLFGGSMIGLFLTYPRRLVNTRWLWMIPAVLGPFFLMDTFRIGLEADSYYVFVMIMTMTILSLIAVQWWATRHSPDERAVLGWLGLSVASAIGIFAFLSLAPGLLGLHSPLAQHYAAGAVVLIYVGLALGLRRYRLFELGEWAYRILYYTVGAFLLLALDAGLVAFLNLDLAPALAVSLLLLGVLYLPLRDWLWRKIFARDQLKQHELFSEAMQVAFAPSRTDSAQRWRDLLQRLFDPLETLESSHPLNISAIAEDGLVLELPPVAGAPGLRLRYPFGGTGLFQQGHLALADNLVSLTERAEESRQAYMRGVGEERRRMARDLHDDVGARLLTGLHVADERTRPILQAALSDIRAIVSGLAGDEAALDRVLAEIRHEAARRLEAAGIEFDCPLPDDDLPVIKLDYRVHKALTSAVREIVSNVIRHSQARLLVINAKLEGTVLALTFSDNGRGLPDAALAGETMGYGLKNLHQRIGDLGGTVTLGTGTGTTIVVRLPLQLDFCPPEPGVQQTAAALQSSP